MTISWLQDFDGNLKDQFVLCRVDFNVPMTAEGEIADTTRIDLSLDTIRDLIGREAKVIVASHMGRPKGKKKAKYSLEPAAVYLQEQLQSEVIFADDCVGDGVLQVARQMTAGSVLVLENLRFHSGEEKNESVFSRLLAQLAPVYVNDAFGAAHRAHASTEGVTREVKVKLGGYLLKKEQEALSKLLHAPKKPFVAIVGGAKVSDKMGVLSQLLHKVDKLLIGGAMAYTFLKAMGQNIGASPYEADRLVIAKSIIDRANSKGVELYFPVDHIVASEFAEDADCRPIKFNQFDSDEMGLDIGPLTITRYEEAISDAKTIFWNGPMGVCEWSQFANGTQAIAKAVANASAYSVVGGGDSVSALKACKLENKISHISTGGGASLEFIEGKELPGLKALT